MSDAESKPFRWPEIQSLLHTGVNGFKILAVEDGGRRMRYVEGVIAGSRSITIHQSREARFQGGHSEQIGSRIERQANTETLVRGITEQLFLFSVAVDEPKTDTCFDGNYVAIQASTINSFIAWTAYDDFVNQTIFQKLSELLDQFGRIDASSMNIRLN